MDPIVNASHRVHISLLPSPPSLCSAPPPPVSFPFLSFHTAASKNSRGDFTALKLRKAPGSQGAVCSQLEKILTGDNQPFSGYLSPDLQRS